MLFNSFSFIFYFLPATLFVYFLLAYKKSSFAQMIWISCASFVFYACWKKIYLILLLVSVGVNYAFAEYLLRNKSKYVLTLGLIFNVAVLAYFKYRYFFVANIVALTNVHWSIKQIALPLGISFITFQKITYLLDIYRGHIQNNSFLKFLVFISFFPQLIAGPIVRYQQLVPQFGDQPKQFRYHNFNLGLGLFIIGLAKKVLLADSAATYVDPAYHAWEQGQLLSLPEAWIAVLAYAMQIYFDFSGYSDMAIGLAKMLGVKLPINFNSPYKSTNIIDFWRRWHMTLSLFLRDFIYIPLGGNRHGRLRKQFNLMITMLIGGLWHGANWTFVIWGGVHGLMLIINHAWIAALKYIGWHALQVNKVYKFLSFCLTFIGVIFAWILFRAQKMATVKQVILSLFGCNGYSLPNDSYFYQLPLQQFSLQYLKIQNSAFYFISFLIFLVLFLPNSQQIMRTLKTPSSMVLRTLVWRPNIMHLLYLNALFYASLAVLLGFHAKPFEYFAF